jgi:branched-chain amino acid transport system ATP-binding protein
MLRLSNVTKRFGGLTAVRDCSYGIDQGRITCLIGPNGAGKTTTFNIISGFMRPEAGIIHFKDTQLNGLSPQHIARLGLVRTFQIPRELNDITVIESLKMAPLNDGLEKIWTPFLHFRKVREREKELESRAREVLHLIGLEKKESHAVRALSGGQRKLLELGRALMFEATLVLLDEPTAGVNPAIVSKIVTLLQKMKSVGTTFFIVEHNMDFVKNVSDHVIVMAEGTSLTEGTFDTVRNHPHVAEAYLGQ